MLAQRPRFAGRAALAVKCLTQFAVIEANLTEDRQRIAIPSAQNGTRDAGPVPPVPHDFERYDRAELGVEGPCRRSGAAPPRRRSTTRPRPPGGGFASTRRRAIRQSYWRPLQAAMSGRPSPNASNKFPARPPCAEGIAHVFSPATR